MLRNKNDKTPDYSKDRLNKKLILIYILLMVTFIMMIMLW
jgi:hypothetical protein